MGRRNMDRRLKARLYAHAALLAFSSAATTALAEQSAPPQHHEDRAAQLDEIIVTATRRSQSLSDVPLAISAIGGETLQNSGANDIRALNQLNPSILISSTGSEGNTSARIRGIGTIGDNSGLESSVAIFIDGVYRSRTGVGLNELGEVERVEVLRGPQGTLFGRNASAGLIHVITKEPEFNFRAYGAAMVGNYDYRRLEGGVTGPLTDNLAGKLEVIHEQRDGFYTDVNTGDTINDRDRTFVRGQLLYQPTETLSARLIADYSERSEACCGAVFATDAISPGSSALLNPATNPVIGVMAKVAGVSLDAIYPSLADPYARRVAISPGTSFEGVTKDWGLSLELTADVGSAELTSITAYRSYKNSQNADVEYNFLDILKITKGDNGRQFDTFSQELRLQGEAFSSRLDWLVGGYYGREDLTAASTLKFGSHYGAFTSCLIVNGISTALMSVSQPGCLTGTGRAALGGNASPTVKALDLLYSISNVGDDGSRYEQQAESAALFTHNIIHLTPTLDLTLGLRYTRETKDLQARFNNTNVVCPQVRALLPASSGIITLACQGNSTSELNALSLADSRTEEQLTGTTVLSWNPIDNWMFYGSYSKGYKAGGFNLDRSALGPANAVQTNVSVANLSFDPEKVNAFELGAKYGHGPLTFSAVAFYQAFENFQLNGFDGTVYVVETINGCSTDLKGADRDASPVTGACARGDVEAGVISKGVELEAQWRPIQDLTLSSGITYADTRYADNLVGDAAGSALSPSLNRLPGQQISNAPKTVATYSLSWTPQIGGSGLSGLVFVNARTTSSYNTGSNLAANKIQEGYTVVNARLGLRGPDDAWSLELYGQNVFDQDYTQVIFDSAFQGSYTAYLADPRTFGVALRARF